MFFSSRKALCLSRTLPNTFVLNLAKKVKAKKCQIFDQNHAFTDPFFQNGNFLAFKYQRFIVFFGQFKRKKSR